MKNILIEVVRKFAHVVGNEFSNAIQDTQDRLFYHAFEVLEDHLDGEQIDYYSEELQQITKGVDGVYIFDNGDFIITVAIS
jgi:hypothetical protein